MKNKYSIINRIIIILYLLSGTILFKEVNAQDAGKDINKKEAAADAEKKADTEKNKSNEAMTLPEVVVKSQKESATKKTVDKSTIDVQGGAAQISPYKAISTVPGVDVRTLDAIGLNVSHRIRGKGFSNDGEGIEGLPIKQRGPGTGLSTIIDLENIDSITVIKGPVPADSGFGSGNNFGVFEMYLKPSDELHATGKQIFGTNDFSRSYARVDSGNVGNVARVFVSGSFTDADKWKGEGNSPDGRKNFACGIASTAGQPIEWELNSFYNDDVQHLYKPLSYNESKHLSNNYKNDYYNTLTGDSSHDYNYYDYNRQRFSTSAFIGKIKTPLPFLGESSLTLKPYYLNEKGFSYGGSKSGSSYYVTENLADHYCYGGILEYQQQITDGQIKAGYWYAESLPPGPNVAQKKRTFNSTTGRLEFNSWSTLIKASTAQYNSPYIAGDRSFGPLTVNAGLRYHHVKESDYDSYKTSNTNTSDWDISYSDAIDRSTEKKYHLNGSKYDIWLPNAGTTYQVFDKLSFKLIYGRNYDNPGGLPNQFDSLYNTLTTTKGYTPQAAQEKMQDLYSNKRKPEVSDNFDLGTNMAFGDCTIESTLYYSYMRNVGGSFYDPDLNMSYQQTNATAQGYGMEIGAGYTFIRGLNAKLAFAYNQYEFTEDLKAAGNTTIDSKGNELPEVPHFVSNLSVNWQVGGLTVGPTARYIGKRYADVENHYSMDQFFVVDLDMNWKIKTSDSQNIALKFSVTNVLNEKYVASSNASNSSTDYQSLTYNVGAPRTFFAGLQMDI